MCDELQPSFFSFLSLDAKSSGVNYWFHPWRLKEKRPKKSWQLWRVRKKWREKWRNKERGGRRSAAIWPSKILRSAPLTTFWPAIVLLGWHFLPCSSSLHFTVIKPLFTNYLYDFFSNYKKIWTCYYNNSLRLQARICRTCHLLQLKKFS